jgi:hypothetical protein
LCTPWNGTYTKTWMLQNISKNTITRHHLGAYLISVTFHALAIFYYFHVLFETNMLNFWIRWIFYRCECGHGPNDHCEDSNHV